MIRKNLLRSLSVIMATMMAVMTVACGSNKVDTVQTEVAQMKEDTGCFDFALDPAEIETYEVPTYFAFSMKR